MYLIEPFRNGEYITDGAYALAMQVYVQNNIFLDEGIIFPYHCAPKVEIGRFQNAVSEVNQDYLEENDILLVRRDTGGGAILVDDGAVNVCFLVPEDTGVYGNYKKMYEPVIKALNKLPGTYNIVTKGGSLKLTSSDEVQVDGVLYKGKDNINDAIARGVGRE